MLHIGEFALIPISSLDTDSEGSEACAFNPLLLVKRRGVLSFLDGASGLCVAGSHVGRLRHFYQNQRLQRSKIERKKPRR